MDKAQIIKEIEAYWKSLENIDEYSCPHGGGSLDFVHCQSGVTKSGLIKHFEGLKIK